ILMSPPPNCAKRARRPSATRTPSASAAVTQAVPGWYSRLSAMPHTATAAAASFGMIRRRKSTIEAPASTPRAEAHKISRITTRLIVRLGFPITWKTAADAGTAPAPPPVSRRRRDLAADIAEQPAEIDAEQRHPDDDCQRDERGDQAVFDGGDAGLGFHRGQPRNLPAKTAHDACPSRTALFSARRLHFAADVAEQPAEVDA